MPQTRPLDVIEIRTPCPADWDQMIGDSSRRFCSHCNKFVHNLSEMPADEAERLVCNNAGNLCVRFARNAETGQTITLDYAPVPKTTRRRAILTIASLLGACGFAGAWAAAKFIQKPAPPVRFMLGDVACPPAPPPPGQQNVPS